MNKLSRFDIVMIVIFVVVALLGGAGWWYLSGELQAAQANAAQVAGSFDQYSKKEVYLPTRTNVGILQKNIEVMKSQLDPLVQSRLQSPKSTLKDIKQVDTVVWKHELDAQVSQLNADAAKHGIAVPNNFYYGFSRYLSTNPAETATDVLKRQQVAIGTIADILINAPVKAIVNVERTAEEDPEPSGGTAFAPAPVRSSNGAKDILPGHSSDSDGNVYTTYPFEFEFDTDTESFRTVLNQILQSDYVFIVRSIQVQNSKLDSPMQTDLDRMAGTSATTDTSIVSSSPGAVAAQAAPTVGLQYLFGDETLHVRMNVDLIDWHGVQASSANEPAASGTHSRRHRAATPVAPAP